MKMVGTAGLEPAKAPVLSRSAVRFALSPRSQCIYNMKIGRYVKASKVARNPFRFKVLNKPVHDTDGVVGQCWPWTGDHVIEIDPRQCPSEYLDTLIHEALHELFPKSKETKILNSGTSVARLLWRLGYRRVKQRK